MSDRTMAVVDAPAPETRAGCGHVPPRFQARFFDSIDPTVSKAVCVALAQVRRIVAGEISMLLLSGPIGSGKSHLAAAACNEAAWPLEDAYQQAVNAEGEVDADRAALRQVVRRSNRHELVGNVDIVDEDRRLRRKHSDAEDAVRSTERDLERSCPRWISVLALLERMKREMNTNDRTTAGDVTLAMDTRGILVLDDLGAEGKGSEWNGATLFGIVSARYDAGLPILVTSNLTTRQLDMVYGRIVSRLQDDGVLIDMTSATDYRARLRRSLS